MLAETREVRPADSRCDCSSQGFNFDLQQVVHPDGLYSKCLRCGREWVEWRTWPKPGDIITAGTK